MIQLISKDEVAERKPYTFGYAATTKMMTRKKVKQMKRMKMANSIVTINNLIELT